MFLAMTSSARLIWPVALPSRTICSTRWMQRWQSWKPRVMACVSCSISLSSARFASSSLKPGSTCFWCSRSSFWLLCAMSASSSETSSDTSAQRGGSRSISITASPSSAS
jgi:hypothetical protein